MDYMYALGALLDDHEATEAMQEEVFIEKMGRWMLETGGGERSWKAGIILSSIRTPDAFPLMRLGLASRDLFHSTRTWCLRGLVNGAGASELAFLRGLVDKRDNPAVQDALNAALNWLEVEEALAGTGTIPKADYERWAQGDLPTRARVYALTASHWSRIHPEPSGRDHCRFMADYLIECLLQNREGDAFLHSGFEAAHELAAWLKHLAKTTGWDSVISEVAQRLAEAYKAADETTRNRIETGALEHALGSRAVRPYFDSWGTDPVLRDAHEHALAWGLAHQEKG